MGLYLIAMSISHALSMSWGILQVAVGLGLVIFVHELGHFLVAKACGVRCDKFFIGFDIGGYKISRKWGETEYGIGILPLGGYVKMLGQDDNPARIAEEMERARIRREKAEAAQQATGDADVATGDKATDAAASGDAATSSEGEEDFVLDPRSYLAKSVPQRMAIISAGVVMNVIFAFVLAVWAYGLGVKYQPCIVSEVVPGSPAWEANLQTGDEITEIDELRKPRFRDLKAGISLGDLEAGVPLKVKRPDQPEEAITLKPVQGKAMPTIGILSPQSLVVNDEPPFFQGTAAADAKPAIQGGDEVIAVDGQPIEAFRQWAAVLAQNPDKALHVTVRRPVAKAAPEQVDINLPPARMKRLGLMMKIGPITAVQADSPAAAAGLRKDDFIVEVDGAPVSDAVALPDYLQQRADQSVTLTITRPDEKGQQIQQEVNVVPRRPTGLENTSIPGTPLSAPALGIAFRVLNRVSAVEPDSPASRADIRPGDEITAAQFIVPPDSEAERFGLLPDKPIEFSQEKPNWPSFFSIMQRMPPDMKVELTVHRGEQKHTEELVPAASATLYNVERGVVWQPLERVRQAESPGEAIALGRRETTESLLMVFRFVRKLGTQVSFRMVGGPVMIAQGAYFSATQGLATLLVFLSMLSANLAVINFLPIPLLDGGHMVFLILEGILRRPVSEKVVIAFHTIGFVLIISLMLFVILLDVGLIDRGM